MVNWEQVINEMELSELRGEDEPSAFIVQDGKLVNMRDLGFRVTSFRVEPPHIDNDML